MRTNRAHHACHAHHANYTMHGTHNMQITLTMHSMHNMQTIPGSLPTSTCLHPTPRLQVMQDCKLTDGGSSSGGILLLMKVGKLGKI